jgi:uncharacterized protein involved in exopolysaccharide biosynthesis
MRDEIDLLDLMRRIWARRRMVAAVAAASLAVGVVVALVSPAKYTAQSVMVPQTGEAGNGVALGGLAAMAGVNIGGETGLGPNIYPQIVASVPFQKELMAMTVDSRERGRTVLLDYLVAPEKTPAAQEAHDGIETFTSRESAGRSALSGLVALAYNKTDGDIRLSATMPEPLMAAQVAQKAQELLQKHVTRLKVQKVQATLDFIEERTGEAHAEFERAQRELASFRDRNRNIVTATAEVAGRHLQNKSDLAFSIYSDLARQREQARIDLKETTPVFTVIEPVTVPVKRSAPNRKMTVAVFTLIGLAAGCALALIKSK